MRLPTMALTRSTLYTVLALAGSLLTACSMESTAPILRETAEQAVPTPADPSKVIYGVSDGTYKVTINPTVNQTVNIGPNRLEIPANSVCKLSGSGYGAAYWNQSCTPETQAITLTIVVSNAASANSRMDFYPAMRFNPNTSVRLYMYVPGASRQTAKSWVMNYCNDDNVCVDESKQDWELTTYVDRANDYVFRRIKHFSGYVVAEFADDGSTPAP